jgi:hypothetical protein
MDEDRGAALEVRLTPWALLAPLAPFSLALVSPVLMLRNSDRALRILGIALLTLLALSMLGWLFVLVIMVRQESRVRLDAKWLTLGRWPRIQWSEIREVRVHELRWPRITRTPTRIVAFVPANPEDVYDTIRQATGPLLRPAPMKWSPYQTPLVIPSARLPIPVDRLLEAVHRLSDVPIGPGARLSPPALPMPGRRRGVLLLAAVFVLVLGVVFGYLANPN